MVNSVEMGSKSVVVVASVVLDVVSSIILVSYIIIAYIIERGKLIFNYSVVRRGSRRVGRGGEDVRRWNISKNISFNEQNMAFYCTCE